MSAHKCKIPYNKPRWITTDTAGDTLKSQPASLFNTGPHSRGTMMIGKIYINNKNAMDGDKERLLENSYGAKKCRNLGQPQEFRERIAHKTFKQDRHQNAEEPGQQGVLRKGMPDAF